MNDIRGIVFRSLRKHSNFLRIYQRIDLLDLHLGDATSSKLRMRTSIMATSYQLFSTCPSSRSSLIAVSQMTSRKDKERNLKTVLELIVSASSKGARMIFFPEACDYIADSTKDSVDMAEPLDGHFVSECRNAAKRHEMWLSLGGIHRKSPTENPNTEGQARLCNTHVIIDSQGEIRATYDKAHLFDLDIPDQVRLCESAFTIPGDRVTPPVPCTVGRIGLATVRRWNSGLTSTVEKRLVICYDMRFPEMALVLAQKGADVITYPSAFTQLTGAAHWETLLRSRAIETQCYVVAAAQTGKHNAKRSSYGHAMVVDPWGTVTAQCSEGTGLCLASIDLDVLDKVRAGMPVMQHRRPDLYGQLFPRPDSFHTTHPDDQTSYKFGHVTVSSSQVFYRTQLSYAFVNIKPVLHGHTLIASIRPANNLSDLSPAEMTDLFMTVQKISQVVKKHFDAPSMTVAVQDGLEAGQTVKHVHVHILPRKRGDFDDNDEVYDHLQNHDKGWDETTKLRTEQEMAEESSQLRAYFYSDC